MNQYVFSAIIFDRDPNPNLDFFPHIFPFAEVAESYDEAQKKAKDKIFDSENGLITQFMTDEDASDRFVISFDREPICREVIWYDEINNWLYADEDPKFQLEMFKKYHIT